MLSEIFDTFDYKNKSFLLNWVDYHNQGVYALFGGKRVVFYADQKGDKHYKQLRDPAFSRSVLISLISLPLLCITIPIKLLSSEYRQSVLYFKRLKYQQKVMEKLKNNIAAIKIQRAFRTYWSHKQAAQVKVKSGKLGSLINSIQPYIPYVQKKGVQLIQNFVVNHLTDLFLMGSCQLLGVDYTEVKVINKAERFLDHLNHQGKTY